MTTKLHAHVRLLAIAAVTVLCTLPLAAQRKRTLER